jgi:hypothetical protein
MILQIEKKLQHFNTLWGKGLVLSNQGTVYDLFSVQFVWEIKVKETFTRDFRPPVFSSNNPTNAMEEII